DTRRPEEDERADRPVRVLDAGTGAEHGVGDRGHRVVLSHHALVEVLGQVVQLLALALDQPGDGDPGPARHHLGDVLLVDALLQEPPAAVLARAEPSLLLGELALELGELPVLELGHLVEIVLALGLLDLLLRLLDLLAQLAEAADGGLLALPLRAERVRLLAEVGQLLLEPPPALARAVVALLLEGLALD